MCLINNIYGLDTLFYAKGLLDGGEHTCVVICGKRVFTSKKRGVAPLLELYDELGGDGLKGGVAADKVVGKAAAMLYLLLGVKRIYAGVISRHALNALEKYGVEVSYDVLTDAVKNRAGDGYCPMESAVVDIDDPREGLSAIRKRLEQLRG